MAEDMQANGISITRNQAYKWLQECNRQSFFDLGYAKRLRSALVFSSLDSIQVLADHLIRHFTSCGSLIDADTAFRRVINPTTYTWSAIISAHAKLGRGDAAFYLFNKMLQSNCKVDHYVFLSLLKACLNLSYVRSVHHYIFHTGLQSVSVGNSLIDTYAKLGSFEEARVVFDKLLVPDVVSCNSIIAACTQYSKLFQAVDYFLKMLAKGIQPDDVTFSNTLVACSSLGTIKKGRLIHHHIIEMDFQSLANVGTSLADMYGKCGSVGDLLNTFESLPYRDVVSWGTLISGCAQCGQTDLTRKYFSEMQKEGFLPNEVTFTSIFAACSNAGNIDEGCMYLKLMTSDFGLKPTLHHCLCIIDLLARAGKLVEAETMMQDLGSSTTVAWRSLLSASKTYGNVKLGERCFNNLLVLDPSNASGYIMMSDIYLDAGMPEAACKIDELREKYARKTIEISRILRQIKKDLQQRNDLGYH
ncbi:hypothetical protein KP509_26G053700 [Ceratopteris richardii]|nr:hypothetical protein KP509_26G053700 [Ceratopteris richardii]KAH7297106.1 hypothetical protein KP509_26G053700 [Ceratopteris richardii]